MEKVWRPVRGMEFRKLGENSMQFVFFSKKDYDRVLMGRPWSFDKFLLVIQEYDSETRPSEVSFDQSPFWIHIMDLPRACMTAKLGQKIGDTIGKCLKVDADERGLAKGMSNIKKPLRRGIKLKVDQGKKTNGSKFNTKDYQTSVMDVEFLVIPWKIVIKSMLKKDQNNMETG